ncbi:UDP-glucose 4-epimerase GalE [Alkalihalobacillus sp. AL-G]|uniref:UDP-glucose 4-epimerase GalE n=1 Tax=Alkalihalobacillus sp. AL-G TaxID=2926399 RepID=UPI00272BA61B|nr:UDP-glucose 4-epimerase GalE [Alkalihalobacillus sp. AL-G]WLD94944.1 UDP-glucose 4-epimerase GalE [Alkalihalobacillus sp. AL-G]
MILVTGGAGYIGSNMVRNLVKNGYEVVVLDNLSTGHKEAVHPDAIFIEGDLQDRESLKTVFYNHQIEAVMHFAANCYVGESVLQPQKYYENNVIGFIHLLNEMIEAKVTRLVFSSSCAVYGIPKQSVIDENTEREPISPYGRTKMIAEKVIEDYSEAYGLKHCILRYFNVTGADLDGVLGEDHQPETHLIPNILQHLQGKSHAVSVYGVDYDTPDGTCIRDYIHVSDLVEAHYLSLKKILGNPPENRVYNLGNGRGYSIKEIIQMCEKVTGKKARVIVEKRRPGDPPRLIASIQKAVTELKWNPKNDMQSIIQSAWDWFCKHPDGYEGEKR